MDDEFDEFLDVYSAKSTSLMFKTQLRSVNNTTIDNSIIKESLHVDASGGIEKNSCQSNKSPDNLPSSPVCDKTTDSIWEQATQSPVFNDSTSCDTTWFQEEAHNTSTNYDSDIDELVSLHSSSDENSDIEEISVVSTHTNSGYHTRSKSLSYKEPPANKKSRSRRQNRKEKPSSNKNSFENDNNYEVTVKVLWKSVNVHRFTIRKFQKLQSVFDFFMELENVDRDRIMLTFKGREVQPNDSPESLNLQILDFIDGGIVNKSLSNDLPYSNSSKGFILKFQDSSKKIVNLAVSKEDNMGVVLAKFAEQVGKPINSIKLFFDGCLIKSTDTIQSLDLESEEVLDVNYN